MSISLNINPTDVIFQAQSVGQMQNLEDLQQEGVTTGDENVDRQMLGLAMEFEKVLFSQMMRSMRKTVKTDGLFGKSMGGETYTEMFDTAIINQPGNGLSLGLAEPLYRQLIAQKGVPTE